MNKMTIVSRIKSKQKSKNIEEHNFSNFSESSGSSIFISAAFPITQVPSKTRLRSEFPPARKVAKVIFALQKWWTKQILNILCIYIYVCVCLRACDLLYIQIYTIYCMYIYTYILCKGSFAGGALVGRCQDELGRALYRIKEEQGVWLKTLILSSSTQRHLILCLCWHQIIAMLWHHPIPWSSQQISTLALQEDLIPNVSIWQTESFTNSPAWSLGNKPCTVRHCHPSTQLPRTTATAPPLSLTISITQDDTSNSWGRTPLTLRIVAPKDWR